jgi:anti-sigma B factor antagonist
MKVRERQAGDITILDVEGRIMYGDGEEHFRDAVTRIMESGKVKLVINMTEVPYIDSAGITELIRTFATTGKRGGGMRLFGLSERARDLLNITRLLPVFRAFDSEDTAIASFDAAPN